MYNGLSSSARAFKCNKFTTNIKSKAKIALYIIIIAVFLFLLIGNFNVDFTYANNELNSNIESEIGDQVDDILGDLDFSLLDSYEYKIGDLGFVFSEKVGELLNGAEGTNLYEFLTELKTELLGIVKDIIKPLLIIFSIIVIVNLFTTLKMSRMNDAILEVINFVASAIIILLIASMLKPVIDLSIDLVNGLASQVNAVLPIILSLLTIIGATSTSLAFSPIITFFSNTIVNILINVLFPIFISILVISLLSTIIKNSNLKNISGFLSSSFKWIIGTIFTVFMATLSIKGLTAGASDGLSIKAAKFAIKNYIPFLGGYISDGFEIVKAGGLLIKNAVGVVSIIVLLFTISRPLLVLGVMSLGLKLFGALSGIADNIKLSNILINISNVLKYLVAIIVGVGLMYLLTFLIILSIGNNIF